MSGSATPNDSKAVTRFARFSHKHVKAGAIALLSFGLFACALSPQYVNINPDIQVQSQTSTPQSVTLNIADHRPNQYFGTRGGVYADTSYIYPKDSLAQSLLTSTSKAVVDAGFALNSPSPNPVQLTIHVDQLSYGMDDSSLPKKVNISVKLRAEAVRGSQRHQGSFNSNKVYSFMTTPNEAENQKIINEILSETLTRLFNDQQLISFMRQG